jgi:hypothetical protein
LTSFKQKISFWHSSSIGNCSKDYDAAPGLDNKKSIEFIKIKDETFARTSVIGKEVMAFL